MDSSFTFPRPQAAVPRSQPPKSTGPSARESNALRASVLDAALELGIGNNSLVADWMFNNAVVEEDEGEYPISSPSLTYGSSATSEESSSSVLTPSSSISSSKYSGAGAPFASNSKYAHRMDGMLRISESEADTTNFDSNLASNAVTFPEVPMPSRPITPVSRKLKKKHKGDGYESDGGYISESVGKKKEKKKLASKDAVVFPSVETEKEAKKRAKEEKKELDEAERKRKKSLISAVKASKKAEGKEAEQLKVYETDGGGILGSKKVKPKKSKSKLPSEGVGGYETDGTASTPVKKSKTRFFKLSNKASRPDLRAEAAPELPMPTPKDVVPLPIAERFATTLSPTLFSSTSPSQMESSAAYPPISPLPSSKVENLSTPLPPLAFQPFAPPPPSEITSSSVPAPRLSAPASSEASADRASHASTDSSLSSGLSSRRKAGHFSPNSSSHGEGSGSHSTHMSSQIEHTYGPTTTVAMLPSPPNSGRTSGGSGSLKLPPISYPNTRSVSPIPSSSSVSTAPIVPLQIAKGLRMKPSLEIIGLSSPRGDKSPSPISPVSPYIMGAPLRSAAPSPALVGGIPSPLQPYSASPTPIRPTNLPADRLVIPRPAGGQPSRSPSPYSHISPPITTTDGKFPRPSQLTIPSSDYIVPSPRHSGLPSPNVLAYYDIPPPSPPPIGPLPTVPPLSANGNTQTTNPNPVHFPSAAILRQRVIDRTPRQLPPDVGSLIHAQANIQRGKESPFPSRPVIPGGSVPTSGLVRQESRVTGTRRYRDFYHQVAAASGPEMPASNRYNIEVDDDVKDTRRARFRDELSFINTENGDDDGDESAEDLRGVLDRFEDRRRSDSEGGREPGRALERSHSYEMLKDTPDTFATSGYTSQSRIPRPTAAKPAESIIRETLYQFDDDGRTVGDRTSRWSGSIYSRASILDEDVSGETRERLVNQVERMLELETKRAGGGPSVAAGVGRGYVPPVPRLPDAYANTRVVDASVNSEATPARSWNRF